jgi:hypothetical protein
VVAVPNAGNPAFELLEGLERKLGAVVAVLSPNFCSFCFCLVFLELQIGELLGSAAYDSILFD